MVTMLTLSVAAVVTWAKRGNGQIQENWSLGSSGSRHISAQIFNGVCIGMLGVTGFECESDTILHATYLLILNICQVLLIMPCPFDEDSFQRSSGICICQ